MRPGWCEGRPVPAVIPPFPSSLWLHTCYDRGGTRYSGVPAHSAAGMGRAVRKRVRAASYLPDPGARSAGAFGAVRLPDTLVDRGGTGR